MDSYLGEIKIVAWNEIPDGWALCSGQAMQVQQNAALYSLIGTAYGGDGRTTFNLPNLNGRVIVGAVRPFGSTGANPVGAHAGAAKVALTQTNMASHTHSFQASSNSGTAAAPAGNICAGVASGEHLYGPMTADLTAVNGGVLATSGAGTPHNNMQPYTALAYIICIQGLYPDRP